MATEPSAPSRDQVRTVSVAEAFPQCRAIAHKYLACVRQHPPSSPTSGACGAFSVLLGWCVTLSLCPAEASALEQCCGGVPELVRCRREQCATHDARLDRCMSRHTR